MDTDALNASADRAAEFLRAVAHPGRLRIICALMEGERSASQLAHEAQLSAPALSQQAAVMEAAGLIARRRNAQSIMYRLVAPEATALAELMYRLFCRPAKTRSGKRGKKGGTPP